jgi:NADH:ubiquinone oxidoreductase subunit 3 (subunit A)
VNFVNDILFLPPVTLVLIFMLMAFQFVLLSRLAFKSHTSTLGKRKAYACGEKVGAFNFHPNYTQFFQFAFFFTVMDVVALIVATVPGGQLRYIGMAIFYIVAAVIGLFILYRR